VSPAVGVAASPSSSPVSPAASGSAGGPQVGSFHGVISDMLLHGEGGAEAEGEAEGAAAEADFSALPALRRWTAGRCSGRTLRPRLRGGLPELTNAGGAFCRDSSTSQAWSSSTLLDALWDLQAHEDA